MIFIVNKPLKENWDIKTPNYYLTWWEAMKHTKLGSIVSIKCGPDMKLKDEGRVTCITCLGINVVTDKQHMFVKWPNVIGVYI